ncbi:ankyrin repeat domain-containing protein [Chitinibacter sp. SCUT-21]|uniref:ankyrin repeat domain-containing protein n=1 Tax=Chitinibacter sp. SCUT-21 TaxID=2970891 RepID=UPI0035A5FBFB
MNPAVLDLLGSDADFYPHHLEESYPRILEQIIAVWGTDHFERIISSLAVDERGGRQGFPPDVASEIFSLYRLHLSRFGKHEPEEQAWDHVKELDSDLSYGEVTVSKDDYFASAAAGNTLRVLMYLKSGINIETADEYGKTALIWAATFSHLPLLGLLLSREANTESRDLGGYSALHWAAADGNLQAIDLLIEHGAQVNAANKVGVTPLMQAASRGKHEAIRRLLEAGADINQTDQIGQTALIHALQTNHYRSSETLLLQHAKIDVAGKDQQTALSLGLSHSNPQIRQLFTKHRFGL